MTEVARNLPTSALGDIVETLLQDPDTSAKAQTALDHCLKKHGYDVIKQVSLHHDRNSCCLGQWPYFSRVDL